MDYRLLALLSFLAVVQVNSLMVKKCPGKPADILFILDESRSIWSKHYKMQQSFVRSLANEFIISPEKVRIGVVSWSDRTFLRWGLNKYTDKPSLLHAIDGLRQAKGGKTNTHDALAKARAVFHEQKRPGVPMVVILMTDGESREKELTAAEGAKLREDNVTVFAIGIGKKADEGELRSIATDDDHVYLTDFEKLNSQLRDQLVTASCEYLGNPQGECDIDVKVDLAFVLGSVNQNPPGAKKAMKFVQNVIADENMFIGPDAVQVALVPKDCIPVGFDLNAYPDKDMAMMHFEFAGEAFEETSDLIDFTKMHTFSQQNGAREGVRKVATVIFDRASPNKAATIRACEAAKAQGIEIIAIGVGDQVDNDEIAAIASDPSMVFNVPDYDELWNLRKEILYNEICP